MTTEKTESAEAKAANLDDDDTSTAKKEKLESNAKAKTIEAAGEKQNFNDKISKAFAAAGLKVSGNEVADAMAEAEDAVDKSDREEELEDSELAALDDDDEPVGSRSATDTARADHLREIEEAENAVSLRELDWEEAKLSQKCAKDAFDFAVEKLRAIIKAKMSGPGTLFEQPSPERKPLEWEEQDGEDGDGMFRKWGAVAFNGKAWRIRQTEFVGDGARVKFDALTSDGVLLQDEYPGDFESLIAAQEWCQGRDDALKRQSDTLGGSDAPNRPVGGLAQAGSTIVDDNSWREISLADLTPPIKTTVLLRLAENHPPMATIGNSADWTAAKSTVHGGNNELIDVAGIGAKAAESIQAALDHFWFTTWPERQKAKAAEMMRSQSSLSATSRTENRDKNVTTADGRKISGEEMMGEISTMFKK